MANIHWGVDSLLPANNKTHVPGNKTLYDLVVDEERRPDFWGRYIFGKPGQVLTIQEAEFLLGKNCRILPIFNGITAQTIKGGSDVGRGHAQDAIQRASNLNIPRGTYIYANIEWDWQPSKEWIIGWWKTMLESQYGGVGGFYCNPAPNNIWFLRPYEKALEEAAESKSIPNIRNLCLLFSSGPSKGCEAAYTNLSWQPPVEPYEPSFHKGSSVLWQYAINCHKVGDKGLYDKDLCNTKGFKTLWQ